MNRDEDCAWRTNTHSSIDCKSGGGQVPHYTDDTKAKQADQQSTARDRRRSTNREAKSQLIRDGHESVARGSVAHAARPLRLPPPPCTVAVLWINRVDQRRIITGKITLTSARVQSPSTKTKCSAAAFICGCDNTVVSWSFLRLFPVSQRLR